VARFVPAIPGYIYATKGKELFVNLYISDEADIPLGNGKVKIVQKDGFPWDGRVEIDLEPEQAFRFDLSLRIPGWARNEAIPGGLYKFDDQDSSRYTINVNGKLVNPEVINGYAVISRTWRKGDKVTLELPMPVRNVVADERITDDRDKIAVQRGPVIFCAEWPDNKDSSVLDLVIDRKKGFTPEFRKDLLDGTEVIETSGYQTRKLIDGRIDSLPPQQVTLIPYAFWNNRGPGQMMVWLPVKKEAAKPLPAPTISYTSRVRAGKMNFSHNGIER
jgi:DUF1680 family protein